MLRRAWSRLVRKQWLIFYPLALAIIDALAFLAVYSAEGDSLRWSAFFRANFDRWQYVSDHFFSPFAVTPTLGIAIAAGFAVCLFAAMIQPPFFRAIAGSGYPLAPRRWAEAGNLLLFYAAVELIRWVLPFVTPGNSAAALSIAIVTLVVLIVVVFADYAIVFEELPLLPAVRRSARLVGRRWPTVLLLVIVFDLVTYGVHALYGLYYLGTGDVFILLPLSQVLVESAITLVFSLVLIFLYEDLRRSGPA